MGQKNLQVSLQNVSKSFREGDKQHDVLKDLCLGIEAGTTVALRGRSGSGKSTLLNLVSGIDLPDSGTVIVGGKDITAMSETERTVFRRANVGFVYQAFNLVPTLSVSDNVRLVLELNGMPRAAADDRIATLLDAVGLGDRADSFPDVLSGGEQQRVAIARAISNEPPLLLADEPTGNLDDRTAASVLELLDTLVRSAGRTMIIVTHSATVAAAADVTLELHDGVVAD